MSVLLSLSFSGSLSFSVGRVRLHRFYTGVTFDQWRRTQQPGDEAKSVGGTLFIVEEAVTVIFRVDVVGKAIRGYATFPCLRCLWQRVRCPLSWLLISPSFGLLGIDRCSRSNGGIFLLLDYFWRMFFLISRFFNCSITVGGSLGKMKSILSILDYFFFFFSSRWISRVSYVSFRISALYTLNLVLHCVDGRVKFNKNYRRKRAIFYRWWVFLELQI